MLLRSINVIYFIKSKKTFWSENVFFTVQGRIKVTGLWSFIVAQHCHLLIHTDIGKTSNIRLNLPVKNTFSMSISVFWLDCFHY